MKNLSIKNIIFLILTLNLNFNIFSSTYFHFANDTANKIKIKINEIKGSENKTDFLTISPHDVIYYNTNTYLIYPQDIEATSTDLLETKKSLNVQKMNYYAFIFRPIIINGKPSFEIKQRTNKDAELILEKHKNPDKPEFVN